MSSFNFDNLKATAFLRIFTFLKLPLIWWVQPSVMELGPDRTVIKIPLSRKTKNHLNVMYFGALAIGGELCVAFKAVEIIQRRKLKVDFLFKDFQAQFLKRAEGDVYFVCEQGQGVEELIDLCINTKQRETKLFHSYAIVPSKSMTEKVAEFQLHLSVKQKTKKS